LCDSCHRSAARRRAQGRLSDSAVLDGAVPPDEPDYKLRQSRLSSGLLHDRANSSQSAGSALVELPGRGKHPPAPPPSRSALPISRRVGYQRSPGPRRLRRLPGAGLPGRVTAEIGGASVRGATTTLHPRAACPTALGFFFSAPCRPAESPAARTCDKRCIRAAITHTLLPSDDTPARIRRAGSEYVRNRTSASQRPQGSRSQRRRAAPHRLHAAQKLSVGNSPCCWSGNGGR